MTVVRLLTFLEELELDAADIESVREFDFDFDSSDNALMEIRIEDKSMKVFERWVLVR
jgi:hypothetical protein